MPQTNTYMAEVTMGADIGRALDRLGTFPSVLAAANDKGFV